MFLFCSFVLPGDPWLISGLATDISQFDHYLLSSCNIYFFKKVKQYLLLILCYVNLGGLTLSPRRGLVLGGTLVEISGPCFNATSDAIVCRFNGSILADGNVVNRYLASCVTPHLENIGRMSLELSLDDGKTFNFTSQFTSG